VLHRIALAVVSEWCQQRHSCFTILLARSTRPRLVLRLLGHASITMTLNCYSHPIPSMGRAAASAMDDALEGDEVTTGEESG
jgi:hypothetical protein